MPSDSPRHAPKSAAHARKATRAVRRSQHDRSAEARTRLLQATVDVLVERGYNGLTTKEVAQRAGFSNGALVHHYRTKADLVVAATIFAFDQALEPSRRIVATINGAKTPIKAFIEDSWQVYFDWTFAIAVEVLVVARTDPSLMARIEPVMRRMREGLIDIWSSAFARAGVPEKESESLIALTLLIVRGMAMDDMWIKDKERLRAMLSLWAEIAISRIGRSSAPSRPSGSARRIAPARAKPRTDR